jgi:MOSC domain-containing protein YiiM
MEEITKGAISLEAGLEGDFKGAKYPHRQISVLAHEDWQQALAELDVTDLPWTTRRANLLITGITLPKCRRGTLYIGPVRLEVTAQTYPCARLEEAHAGWSKRSPGIGGVG